MSKEADTCREYVVPELKVAGWDSDPHSIPEKHALTGWIITFNGKTIRRGNNKRTDYLLRYSRVSGRAVAKAADGCKSPGSWLVRAKLDRLKAPQHKAAIARDSLLPIIFGIAFKGIM